MDRNNKIKVGCCGFGQYKRQDYFKRMTAVEYQQSFIQPPKRQVAARLAEQSPPGFEFVVRAWQGITHEAGTPGYKRCKKALSGSPANYGLFQPTEEVAQAWEVTAATARALGSTTILYETPASFTPTARNRRNMEDFFAADDRKDWVHVWDPRGIWSTDEVQGLCRDLGILPCLDPLALETFPVANQAYLKVRLMGSSHPVPDSDLMYLAQGLALYGSAHCIFNTTRMFTDARKLMEYLDSPESFG